MSNIVISQKAIQLASNLELLEGESFYFKPELLSLVFEYVDGILLWKIRPANCVRVGDRAGSLTDQGYRQINYKKKLYQEHRLVFSMFNGPLQKSLEVDHINGIRDDNRLENLRAVSRRVNQQNKAVHRSGNLVGASFNKEKNLWESRIQVNKRSNFIGYFKSEQQANAAYLKFCKENNL